MAVIIYGRAGHTRSPVFTPIPLPDLLAYNTLMLPGLPQLHYLTFLHQTTTSRPQSLQSTVIFLGMLFWPQTLPGLACVQRLPEGRRSATC